MTKADAKRAMMQAGAVGLGAVGVQPPMPFLNIR